MRGEVDPDDLALEVVGGLDARDAFAAVALDAQLGVAVLAVQDVGERRVLPRGRVRVGAVVGRHARAPFGRDQLAVRAEHHERRDPLHLELLAQRGLGFAVREGQREPRLLAEVAVERALVAVARHEDDLELVLEAGAVPLGELRREAPARRAPVGAEVEGHGLARGDERVLHGHLAETRGKPTHGWP